MGTGRGERVREGGEGKVQGWREERGGRRRRQGKGREGWRSGPRVD